MIVTRFNLIPGPGAREHDMVELVRKPDHATADLDYNEPDLSAREFLLRMMRNRTVPLSLRVDAANHLMRLGEPPSPVVTIKIQGGVPDPVDADTADLLAQHPMLRLVQ
jgi:hypothetical protein